MRNNKFSKFVSSIIPLCFLQAIVLQLFSQYGIADPVYSFLLPLL